MHVETLPVLGMHVETLPGAEKVVLFAGYISVFHQVLKAGTLSSRGRKLPKPFEVRTL